MGGNRYIGGMSSTQAMGRNVGTCTVMSREMIEWEDPTSRIPMQRAGAEKPVVVEKPL